MTATCPNCGYQAKRAERPIRFRRPMRLEDLPRPNTKRWVVRRKAAVIVGIEIGLLTEAQAIERYKITAEELAEWRAMLASHGIAGLRVTHLQEYRGASA